MDNHPQITSELIEEHGLKADEYQKILDLIGREPSLTELGIFSAMWNEHCSYKSSKLWLKTLPTSGPQVIQGPGENAGVVDIGDGQAVIFKMESHNHPSFIEPYQGATTGVGGILRDVFTMGARPVAALNALRFGDPSHPKTKHLVSGVVAGVGGYGNSFGVPTVGGEVNFHSRYNTNILVNAMAVGIADTDKIFYAEASGVGNPIVYLGSKTGRDGIHGASMASAEFDDNSEEKRPTVQVGDPFAEKRLLEACLELMQSDSIIAIQDMGAAGLTCSAVEMGAKGNLGVRLDLEKVPCREEGMTPYEMMLSESQERMLMVLQPGKEDIAKAIFEKWDLDFAIVGETTDDLMFDIRFHGEQMAHLPIKELGDEAPEYDRPYTTPPKPLPLPANIDHDENTEIAAILETMMGSHALSSRRWVWEQYDNLVQGNTAQIPGGDSGVVRVDRTQKGLAMTTDVNPRYCEANPIEGGKQAVAEAWRNLISVGATPLACTDNLNFGNPERPEIMAQFVDCIKGIGEACETLKFPIVSGNVSLYNETNGKGILPTPCIGGVGLIKNIDEMTTVAFKQKEEFIFEIGGAGSHLGQSIYLQLMHSLEAGDCPEVNLDIEAKHGAFILEAIAANLITAVHDISDGGLLVAIAEMALASNIGAKISLDDDKLYERAFGEDQSRYVITCSAQHAENLKELAVKLATPVKQVGTTGGSDITINTNSVISLEKLRHTNERFFSDLMNDKLSLN